MDRGNHVAVIHAITDGLVQRTEGSMKSRILVIDDEESLRFTFERFLASAGYDVETAEDYRQASAAIAEKDFDLVFADIILGGKTGIDILREVKEKNPACPVVMITGCPEIATASDAVRLGAFDYIPKPVQKDTLLRVAALALKHKQAIDEKERYRANLEAIFKSVRDAIITVDEELVVVEVNEAAKNIYGLSRDDAGKPLGSFPKGCNGKCLEALAETIRKKRPLEVYRHECQFNNQKRRVVSLTTSPLLDPQGVFSGAVMVVRDETRLADLERDLEERRQFHQFTGRCGKMQKVYSLIEDLANIETTVLVTGESGTGKELAAEALHYAGERKDRPLVKVNCSALPESLLESELFGHVKGAFTGAIRDKQGRFQLAEGGTIFLDEIGDVSPRVQQRLLRVLQQKEFERVGESTPRKADVRIIAATNKDLREKVKAGEFREDLYYRLNVVEVALPPIRDRREDIPLLVDHFIKRLNAKLGKGIDAVSDDVLKVFMNHPWPGNVRQLEHVLEHAFILCRQNTLTVDDLPEDFAASSPIIRPVSPDGQINERVSILQALEKAGGNKTRTAKLLGMSRRTIYRKMSELDITDYKQ
jgi:PAS domain S-box-containing protein